MLIALREMSIGDDVVCKGDVITPELQKVLPPGRIESLKNQRWVEEITDEQKVARAVDDIVGTVLGRLKTLEDRVASLEALVTPQKVDGRTREGRAAKKQAAEEAS